jgi:lipopolysaccharide heptosyltransferase II
MKISILPPLFFSVRVPTLLAVFWRHHFGGNSRPRPAGQDRRSFIIFRLDALGDVVMTTPLFRELKRAFPSCRLTVVVQHAFRSLLITNPHIDEVLTPPKLATAWLPSVARKLLGALLLYRKSLRTERYDVAISPRWEVDEHLSTLLCLLCNATERIGYTEQVSAAKRRLNRGFDRAFSICLPAGPVQHEALRNLAVLKALGGNPQESSLEIHLSERDRQFASRLLAKIAEVKTLVGVGIGAHSPGRRWPLERYAETVRRLASVAAVHPIIFCSAAERNLAHTLAEMLQCEVITVCGAPLRQVCAMLERCELFIGNDSGAAHLAAAMGCKTIVISRHPQNGDPDHPNSPYRFGPYCKAACVLQPQAGLDACADACRAPGPHCITAVSVERVVAAAQQMLDRYPRPVPAMSQSYSTRSSLLPLAVAPRPILPEFGRVNSTVTF